MHFTLEQLTLSPGSEVTLNGVSWRQFDRLDTSANKTRVAYNQGRLNLMAPSAEHEYDKKLLANLIELLLDTLERDFIGLGSVTLKHEGHAKGVEPDECYYIQNAHAIRGKSRIELPRDPPPDLVLEVDIHSKTDLSIYQALGIPELWLYQETGLSIYLLHDAAYIPSESSCQFPFPGLCAQLSRSLERGKTLDRRMVIQEFRAWLARMLTHST